MPKGWRGVNSLSDSVMGGGPDTALSAGVEEDEIAEGYTYW